MTTTRNLPGFNAEAALYKSEKHYAAAATGAAVTSLVVPQIPIGLCTKALYYCNRGYQKWCDIYDRNCEDDV